MFYAHRLCEVIKMLFINAHRVCSQSFTFRTIRWHCNRVVGGFEFDLNVTMLISVHTNVCGGQVLQRIRLLVFSTYIFIHYLLPFKGLGYVCFSFFNKKRSLYFYSARTYSTTISPKQFQIQNSYLKLYNCIKCVIKL